MPHNAPSPSATIIFLNPTIGDKNKPKLDNAKRPQKPVSVSAKSANFAKS